MHFTTLSVLAFASWVIGSTLSHHDETHRIAKRPHITPLARLHARDAGGACGTGMRSCPSSLGGSCCPENYECARESCYATTKGPSTCGTKVGWYACAAVYGGGCCPDGYLCQRAANCVPPSGSPYSYDCPSSRYLCPASMNYGCCPHGMACGVDQCLTSSAAPVTVVATLTTTRSDQVVQATRTETMAASMAKPTAFPAVDPNSGGDEQRVLKYYPAAVPKVSPESTQRNDARRRISGGQIGGIVVGCVSFVALALIVSYVVFRRLKAKPKDQGVPELPDTGPLPRDIVPQTPASEIYTPSGGPFATSSSIPRYRSAGTLSRSGYGSSEMMQSAAPTPITPSDRDHPATLHYSSSFRSAASRGYTDAGECQQPPAELSDHAAWGVRCVSHASGDESPVRGRHTRHPSDVSDFACSAGAESPQRRPAAPQMAPLAELDAGPCMAELPSSPSSMASGVDDWLRSGSTSPWLTPRPPPSMYNRIDGWASAVAASRLDVVDEEKQSPLQ
ncbi:hypothetical protein HIM_06239 [Hirsutella minnesotensis 3608]|uniref:Granulins domain-containing protein n=1 Tax=Hirsutella minnesotensis 3608 TaxID=1043627 RepID=A0A0F8A4Z3_9HYPO|nr:hypothetical protein HIM_06239 [Hirsutella minnesotensis 3608]